MQKREAAKLSQDLSKSLVQKIQKEGRLDMTVFVISGDQARIITGFDPNSSKQKEVAAEISRFLAKKYRADCIAICAESFYADIEHASKQEQAEFEQYRQSRGTMQGHPLCKEAVFVSVDFKVGATFHVYPFERDDRGAVVSMGEPITKEGAMIDGVLANLMAPEKRVSIPDEVLAAMESEIQIPIISTESLGIYVAPAASPRFS